MPSSSVRMFDTVAMAVEGGWGGRGKSGEEWGRGAEERQRGGEAKTDKHQKKTFTHVDVHDMKDSERMDPNHTWDHSTQKAGMHNFDMETGGCTRRFDCENA